MVDVIASLHTTRRGCIACIVRNAGIARIACNDRNDVAKYHSLSLMTNDRRQMTIDE